MSAIVTFGEFELDEPRFELRQRGQPVVVQPKVLRLLLLLVAQRHRAISDDELLASVWPHETVSRASIKRAVMGARTALGNRGQDCIRTVRGHGYQFVMPVQEAAAAPTPSAAAAPAASTGGAGDRGFVGRDGVLEELDANLAAALAGRGRCVLLVGEPGIGKTRTLHELGQRAAARGARVALGRCMEFDGAPAFWPVLQILRELVRERSAGELQTLLGPGAPDVAAVFPELLQRLPDLAVSPQIGSLPARFRFFDSMASFLARCAHSQPLVLLLDDLQRADQPTLRLLVFLVRQLDTARVLVVGTARSADHRDPGVAELLAELTRQSGARSIALQGLGEGELARYLEARTGTPVPLPVVRRLHEQTDGNPLFLEEILASSRSVDDSRSAARWDTLARIAHQRGVHGAIERHLGLLSEPCRALLAAAAVLGRDFSLGLLVQLVETPAQTAIALLSEAVSAGVVQTAADNVAQHRFTHALIRDVLYEKTPLFERASRHARAGLALEARGAGAHDAQLAEMTEHFLHAAPTHDGGRALRYAQRAARSAMQRLAYEEAAEYLRRALQVLELGEPDPGLRMELLLARGEALALGAELGIARATLLEAAALARALGANDVIVRAASLLARPRESGTADPVQTSLLREALALLQRDDPRTPCLQAQLAKSLSYTSEHVQRAALALQALELTRRLHDPALRAEALEACHEALAEPDYLAERVQIVDELMQLAHRHGDPCLLLHASTARVQNCVQRGDMAGVDAAISTLEALAEQVREPFFRWYAKTFRVMRAMVAGKLDVAEQRAREALQLGALVGEELAYHQYCVQVTGIYRFTGRFAEAEAMTRDISARHPAIAGWRAALGCVEAELGHKELARQTLAQLMDHDLATVRRDPFLLSALCPVAELCVRVGDAASAKLLYAALLPYENDHGNVSFGGATYGPIALPLGRLAMRMGDLKAARRHCEQGIAAAERMPSPTFIALGCLSYAYVLKHLDRPEAHEQAREHLRRAWALADASAMHGVSVQCRALGKQLGAAQLQPSATN